MDAASADGQYGWDRVSNRLRVPDPSVSHDIVGEATWPAIIDRATHDRLVGLLADESRRPANYGRPRVHPLAGLLYCGSCGGPLVTYLQPRQTRGYGCRKDENLVCPGRVRIAAEPLGAFIEGHVIDMCETPMC